ncbi:MAG: hypothetical protein LBG19_05935 [Prevotellaceae bacterium]|jgi:hypothetical protein|nr:hypothetical protein [Prevotellaceae bacterium]
MDLEASFIPCDYLEEDWDTQEANSYWGSCNLNRKSNIGNLKCGVQFIWGCLVLDMAIWLGVMHQNVKHSNKRNPKNKYDANFEDIITPLFYDEGEYFVLTFRYL